MRKIGWIAAGMALAVMAGVCGEAAGDPAAESSTLLPGFSSESELIGFLKERRTYYDVAVYSDAEPDLFAKPGYIPEGYVLDEIVLSPGSENSAATLSYVYRSESFLDYDSTVTDRDLATDEADQAYHDYQTQSTYSFNRGPETMASMPTDGNYLSINHMVPSALYPDVYVTSDSPQIPKDAVHIAWLDEMGHFCTIQMPYDLFEEEDITIYTEAEYFYIDVDAEELVMVE